MPSGPASARRSAMIGVAYFREPITMLKIVSVALIIVGVIGLSLPAKPTN